LTQKALTVNMPSIASQKCEIAALLTTVTEDFDRACMESGASCSKGRQTTMRSSRFNYCDILSTEAA
jgi:hypothetical protein